MRTHKKQKTKAAEAPMKHDKVAAGWIQVSKMTNRTRVQCPQPTGSAEALHAHLLEEDKGFAEATKVPKRELCPEQTHLPSTKMKLQLFPVDEGTCMGLERDGYHPYLELTVSARKKISSVLKHLNNKWGASSVALGEPFLFPYDRSEKLASHRWTLNNSDISAGDVYAAIGEPSVFRLRYGWSSNSKTGSSEVLLTKNSAEVVYGILKQLDTSGEKLEPITIDGATDAMIDKMPSNELVENMDNGARMNVGVAQSSALWDDSLTNISVGGLLSEASLQGRPDRFGAKPNGSSTILQPPQVIADSFDAFIAGQVNVSQGPRPTTHVSATSILDAEDTCHAFPFQKFSCSDKHAEALGGRDCCQPCDKDAGSMSFNHPNMPEFNVQSGYPQGPLSLHSQLYKDESSLGLSAIKWTDSLGTFDLGLNSSGKIISGDSLSTSKLLASSHAL